MSQDLASFDDLFRAGRDEILSRRSQLSADAADREGTDLNIMLAAMAAVGDEVLAHLATVAAGLFLDSAEKDALARLVFDRYGITRKPAAPAVGTVEFTLPTPAVAAFQILGGTVLSTPEGTQYEVVADTTFPAGSTTTSVTVVSKLAGLAQAAKVGTITSIVSPIAGAPADLTVNNATATAGADDAELDESLRARARAFWTTARRGVGAAIEARALAVPGVRRATVFEAVHGDGRPARYVQLVVADAFTDVLATLTTTPPTYASQSSALATTVFNALSDTRAMGIYVEVLVAQVILQPIKLALGFKAGADAEAVTRAVRAAVVSYVNALRPGQKFTVSGALAVIKNTPGLAFTGNEIVAPAGTVVPQPLQVLRTTMALVAATQSEG